MTDRPQATTTTTILTKESWLSIYGKKLSAFDHAIGGLSSSIATNEAPIIETACYEVVDAYNDAVATRPVPDARADNEFGQALGLVTREVHACQTSPRTAGGLSERTIVDDDLAMGSHLDEMLAALRAP